MPTEVAAAPAAVPAAPSPYWPAIVEGYPRLPIEPIVPYGCSEFTGGKTEGGKVVAVGGNADSWGWIVAVVDGIPVGCAGLFWSND